MRAAAIPILLCALCAGCSDPPEPARRREPPPPPRPIADAGAWASRIAPAQATAPGAARAARARVAPASRAAVMSDEVEASDETVFAGRLVYRVGFTVPPSFRDHRAVVQAPAGELHVDVSMNRLRARLLGPGWPVDEGTEIRLRGDLPGVYLFDGRGGRSLGAGQLAAWFEGHEGLESKTGVGVRHEYGPEPERPLPGELLCALLAEWANLKRAALAYRCTAGTLPPGFRVGPWSGELTAVVPMQLPRRTLRADQGEPPPPIPARRARALLEPYAIAKLRPSRPVDAPAPAQLLVENRTETRAILIAQGVAVGWLDAGESLGIDGFAPGYYRIGAVRPLGIMRMPPRLVRVPGALVIGVDRPEGEPAQP
jgi:hypothetical protein